MNPARAHASSWKLRVSGLAISAMLSGAQIAHASLADTLNTRGRMGAPATPVRRRRCMPRATRRGCPAPRGRRATPRCALRRRLQCAILGGAACVHARRRSGERRALGRIFAPNSPSPPRVISASRTQGGNLDRARGASHRATGARCRRHQPPGAGSRQRGAREPRRCGQEQFDAAGPLSFRPHSPRQRSRTRPTWRSGITSITPHPMAAPRLHA